MEQSKLPQLSVFVTIRAGKRQAVTKSINKINSSINQLSLQDCKCYTDKLPLLRSALSDLDDKISSQKIASGEWSENTYTAQLELDREYSDKIGMAVCQLDIELIH